MENDYLKEVELYNTRSTLPDPEKSVLLVIDMQEHFSMLADIIVDHVLALIDACRFSGVPIIFTRHGHVNPAEDGGLLLQWWGEAIQYGSPDWGIVAVLKPQDEDLIIDKNRYSAFYRTNLDAFLQEREISDVIICGLLTNCCCETTARDAFMRDYRVFFLSDATTTVAEELHIASLKNLAYGFARILETDSLCRYLKYSATRRIHRGFT
ncbi:MAG: isochorismatase family protein [Syntrophaceae bacterium]|nr:isochorismatase family protein [Syntrophaceae bacterium]